MKHPVLSFDFLLVDTLYCTMYRRHAEPDKKKKLRMRVCVGGGGCCMYVMYVFKLFGAFANHTHAIFLPCLPFGRKSLGSSVAIACRFQEYTPCIINTTRG